MARATSTLRLLALGATIALAACGGSSYSNPNNGNGYPGPFPYSCDPGTQVQLANPQPGQTGVPTNIGQIIIVANGNANTLYNTYGNWNLTLSDNFGNFIQSGQLSLVPYPSGPHPYTMDFYYAANIPSLAFGRNYNVQLVQSFSNCSGYSLFGFST